MRLWINIYFMQYFNNFDIKSIKNDRNLCIIDLYIAYTVSRYLIARSAYDA